VVAEGPYRCRGEAGQGVKGCDFESPDMACANGESLDRPSAYPPTTSIPSESHNPRA
jgi:hypothetical protein